MTLLLRHNLLKILLLILLIGGGLYFYGPFAKATGPQVSAPSGPPPIPVGMAESKHQDVPLVLTGLGNVQALQQTLVRSQVDGQLVEVDFHEGREVKAGDVLARIDPRIYEAAVNQALAKKAQDEAQLANARLDVGRYQELVDRNFISRQQLDTTKAQVAQLEAAVKGDQAAIDNAKVLLDYTTIRAPISGRLGIRLVDKGNIIHATDANGLVVLAQLHPIAVIFTLPEDQVTSVLSANRSEKLSVNILSRDGRQVLDRGYLELVDNQIDPTTAMFKLKAICDNDKGLLWPGEFVNAQLQVGAVKDAVTVPAEAVQRGQQGAFIWVVKDGQALARPVKVGQVDNGTAVVEEGLDAGEWVVTSGQYRLQTGSSVVQIQTASARQEGAK